jgi:predicted DNA-binding helix-hairpin-helix protein
MATLEKIAHLSLGSCFDSLGQSPSELIVTEPDADKISALGKGTRYDVCASSSTLDDKNDFKSGICHAFTHDGRCVSLFKTLYTNACSHQCNYCSNSSNCANKSKRYAYKPEELAKITLSLYRYNYIEGLFLSSGSGRDEDAIMEKIVETARLLRDKYSFEGYIHLKILPGASHSHIQEAMELADRVSINLEATSESRMVEMSSTKNYESDIVQRQRYIRDLMPKINLPAGQTTQIVVGGCGESDQEIFKRVLYEYREIGVKRTYYSAFCPIEGTAFQSRQKEPVWREHRLYQVDWLYRIYHFSPGEISYAFDQDGFLENSDPKLAIARESITSPLDPNSADYRDLIRVPGIGPKSAMRILGLRKEKKITKREELAYLGVRVKRATPFLKLGGWTNSTLDRWFS